mgnify:CR=1 FL=1
MSRVQLALNVDDVDAAVAGTRVQLTPHEFDLLALLAKEQGAAARSVESDLRARWGDPVGCIGSRWYPPLSGKRDGAQRRPGAVSVVRAEGRSPQPAKNSGSRRIDDVCRAGARCGRSAAAAGSEGLPGSRRDVSRPPPGLALPDRAIQFRAP